jgi:hypothetical protein
MSRIKIDNSPAKAELCALGLPASIPLNLICVLLEMIVALVSQWGSCAGALSDRESFIFCGLSLRLNQFAR